MRQHSGTQVTLYKSLAYFKNDPVTKLCFPFLPEDTYRQGEFVRWTGSNSQAGENIVMLRDVTITIDVLVE